MREVNHRVKNQYSVILSMIRETNKRSDNPDVFERQVRERIMALGAIPRPSGLGRLEGSYDLSSCSWHKPSRSEMKTASRCQGRRLRSAPTLYSISALPFMNWPPTRPNTACSPARPARSPSRGKSSILHAEKLVRLTWNETDGPKVQSIANSGFGTVVLKRVAPQALSGTGDLQYGPHGVVWTLEAPWPRRGLNLRRGDRVNFGLSSVHRSGLQPANDIRQRGRRRGSYEQQLRAGDQSIVIGQPPPRTGQALVATER